jgi:hypothetical protein
VRFPAPIGVPRRGLVQLKAHHSARTQSPARTGRGKAGETRQKGLSRQPFQGQLFQLCHPRRQSRLFSETPREKAAPKVNGFCRRVWRLWQNNHPRSLQSGNTLCGVQRGSRECARAVGRCGVGQEPRRLAQGEPLGSPPSPRFPASVW